MDGAGDAVLQFKVHLGHGVFGEYGGVGDVTYGNFKILSLWDFRGRGNWFVGCGKEMTRGRDTRIAADSTMLRMVNLLIALSLGVHLEQLEHRIGFTCPLPFLLRPL